MVRSSYFFLLHNIQARELDLAWLHTSCFMTSHLPLTFEHLVQFSLTKDFVHVYNQVGIETLPSWKASGIMLDIQVITLDMMIFNSYIQRDG